MTELRNDYDDDEDLQDDYGESNQSTKNGSSVVNSDKDGEEKSNAPAAATATAAPKEDPDMIELHNDYGDDEDLEDDYGESYLSTKNGSSVVNSSKDGEEKSNAVVVTAAAATAPKEDPDMTELRNDYGDDENLQDDYGDSIE